MAVDPENFAPYSAVAPTFKVLERLRTAGWADPVTTAFLERIGVPQANTTRMLQTLRWLGLVEADGRVSDVARQLRKASQAEYPELLAAQLQVTYQDVFVAVDPATANDLQLRDAFRGYEPQAQVQRMIVLFLALCKEAGLVPQGQRPRAAAPRRSTATRVTPGTAIRVNRQQSPSPSLPFTVDTQPTSAPTHHRAHRYPALQALFDGLPTEGRWTASRRERWLSAVQGALDYEITIEPDTASARSFELPGGDASRSEATPEGV